MHRCILRLLLPVVVLSCAMGFTMPGEADGHLRVATFQAEVTLPLGHLLYAKPLQTVEHPLLAKGVVLDDGNRRYVLCAVDWCTMCTVTRSTFRRKIAAAAEADVSRVTVQCVHQHTAPPFNVSVEALIKDPADLPKRRDLNFLDQVTGRLAAAVRESLGRLEPFDPRTDGSHDPTKNRATMKNAERDPNVRRQAASRLLRFERLGRPIELASFELGPASVIHLPGEPMIEFQKYAQRVASEKFVAVAGYGLGTPGYICLESAFEEGGYEPSASAVVPESEKRMKTAIRQMLGVESRTQNE